MSVHELCCISNPNPCEILQHVSCQANATVEAYNDMKVCPVILCYLCYLL